MATVEIAATPTGATTKTHKFLRVLTLAGMDGLRLDQSSPSIRTSLRLE
jgi:hypothetical protein